MKWNKDFIKKSLKNLTIAFSIALSSLFLTQETSFASKRDDQLRRLQEKMDRIRQRQANIQQMQALINQIKGMQATDPTSADQRCRAIAQAANFLKTTRSPKRPFDGRRAQFRSSLQNLRAETKRQARGLTCDQIDFMIPDDSESGE